MGVFDSFYIKIKCPKCGEVSLMECQTKDLSCLMMEYEVGDYVDDKYNYVDCITSCESEKCIEREKEKLGYESGIGYLFQVRVYLKDGYLINKYKVL